MLEGIDLDVECRAMCEAMNKCPGITTVASCCGHGAEPFRIWFVAANLEVLPMLIYYLDVCHSGCRGWTCRVTTDCAASPVKFCVEGPVKAYGEAQHITELIEAEAKR